MDSCVCLLSELSEEIVVTFAKYIDHTALYERAILLVEILFNACGFLTWQKVIPFAYL